MYTMCVFNILCKYISNGVIGYLISKLFSYEILNSLDGLDT